MPCITAMAHDLTHSLDTQAAVVHEHDSDVHRHEHDAEHHGILLDEGVSVVTIRKSKILTQGNTDSGTLKIGLFNRVVPPLESNQSYPVGSDPPDMRYVSPHLSFYQANAPPA